MAGCRRKLGQQEFTRLVHYAYDKRYPLLRDCSESYVTPAMLGEALKAFRATAIS
jgi:hypothetical protein